MCFRHSAKVLEKTLKCGKVEEEKEEEARKEQEIKVRGVRY